MTNQKDDMVDQIVGFTLVAIGVVTAIYLTIRGVEREWRNNR